MRANLRQPVTLAAWFLVAMLLAIGGPFGSYAQVSFAERLAFWLVVAALAIVLAVAARVVVFSRLGFRDFWRGGTMTSALVALVLCWPTATLLRRLAPDERFMPPDMAEMALFVFCLSLGFCAIRHGLEQPAAKAAPAQAMTARPRLLERLPAGMQGAIQRISGRDHYVEVATPGGSTTLLMRFSDALAELDGLDGLQVHRSHWVASDAVAATVREGSRVFLRLSCGMLVPVSRTYLPQVEARGWLDQA